MYHVNYNNIPNGASKFEVLLNYFYNVIRTWYKLHIKFPWVKYKGFERIGRHTIFTKGFQVEMGENVQFGPYCMVSADVLLGNSILMAGHVCLVGKHDHIFNVPGKLIWNGNRGKDGKIFIEDDVWIGYNSIILGGVRVGKGSIVAAGSVVTKDIPPCEIWGGNPAKKIRDRFESVDEKNQHLNHLQSLFAK